MSRRLGWKRDALKVGGTVVVEASRARDDSNHGNARSVLLTTTGQKLFAGQQQ